MIRLFKVTALALAVVLAAVALAGWWYLHSDSMEPPALAGNLQTGSLQHAGLTRTWLAYVPAAKAASPALLLVMHGSMGDGEQMRIGITRYGFDLLAERHGFVVAYPDGYERHWNDCRAGANYTANLENIDDVGFLSALVQRMVKEQGVDPARVFATGLSNGGQMAYRLGLEAPDLVAGIAAVGANLPAQSNFDCVAAGAAVAALIINGTVDPVNPYGGGVVEVFGDTSRGMVLSSQATADYWAGLAGRTGKGRHQVWPDRSDGDGTRVESTEWAEPGERPVGLVTIVGGGHTFPHPSLNMSRILGPTSHELDGAEVIWSFFAGSELVGRGAPEQP